MASIGTLNIVRKDAVGADYDRSFQLAKQFNAPVFFIAPDSISAAIQGDPNRFDLNEIVEIKSKLSAAGLAFEDARDANGKHVITVDLNKKPITTGFSNNEALKGAVKLTSEMYFIPDETSPTSEILSGALQGNSRAVIPEQPTGECTDGKGSSRDIVGLTQSPDKGVQAAGIAISIQEEKNLECEQIGHFYRRHAPSPRWLYDR
jgi:hypothetical protein